MIIGILSIILGISSIFCWLVNIFSSSKVLEGRSFNADWLKIIFSSRRLYSTFNVKVCILK